MLPPIAFRPAGFWNDRQLDRAELLRRALAGDDAETMPSFEIVIDVALAGIVICGSSG